MKTEINPKFIEAMQKRLDEKEDIYMGDLNYKNMDINKLLKRLFQKADMVNGDNYYTFRTRFRKNLIDLANFCWMLWERLEASNENNL